MRFNKLFITFCLILIMFAGNFSIKNSFDKYLKNTQIITKMLNDGVSKSYEKNGEFTKEKVLEFIRLASNRDLDFSYIKPWLAVNYFLFNLVMLGIFFAFYRHTK